MFIDACGYKRAPGASVLYTSRGRKTTAALRFTGSKQQQVLEWLRFAWAYVHYEMALTAEDVVSLLDSSFPAADSSDDDLGMDIEQFENPHYNPDSEQGVIIIL